MALLERTARPAGVALVLVLCIGAAAARAEPVSVRAAADRRMMAIGDTVSLNMDIAWESGVEVKPVAAPDNLGDFIVRDVSEGAVRPEGEGFARRVSLLLTIFEVVEHTIPPVPVLFTGADGRPGRVETEPVMVEVESVLAEGGGEIRDIKPPLSVPRKGSAGSRSLGRPNSALKARRVRSTLVTAKPTYKSL